jgi:peptidoglycan/xylan/chitin deacetylase (PgdA/CDA1 family)
MSTGVVFLMYHEIQLPQRELCETDPGYVRYVVTENHFREHLALLHANAWQVLNVTDALKSIDEHRNAEKRVCLTFDDGSATDLLVVAPLLREKNFNATFYVTVNHLGRPGYLTPAQLRELSDLGFEIGSHAMTHRYLNNLDLNELEVEISESKHRLEQLTGRPVVHFSCPGGRMNSLLPKIAIDAGYKSVATSRPGSNGSDTDRFSLARVPVMRGTTAHEFEQLCLGEGLRLRRFETAILDAAKRVLGNTVYTRIRSTVLGRNPV